ncbi:MAG: Rne/Rng family ribonuclease, partial [Acidobacteria bacterium]|nr:Rne/Rng family ribonuclease [Acidobacteriota bacterium]
MEATQERAEPLLDAEPEEAADETAMDEAPEVTTIQPPARMEESQTEELSQEAEGGGRKRGRRGRRRGKGSDDYATESPIEPTSKAASSKLEDITTPFIDDRSSFQRIVDEDEAAAENGAMLKDAMIQERISDQIHAVEFDMEDVPTIEVGSLFGAEAPSTGSFQRIDDSDFASTSGDREPAYVQETVAAHVGAFIDEINEETTASQTFERVSDDEGEAQEATEAGAKGGKTATAKRSAKKETKAPQKQPEEETAKPMKRASKTAAPKSAAKKPAAAKKTAGKKSSTRRGKAITGASDEGETDIAVLESEAKRVKRTDVVASKAADGAHFEAGSGDDGDLKDAEASISTGRKRAELATRRGGRRRRRPGKPQEGNGTGEDHANGKDEESEVATVAAEVEEPVSSKPDAPAPIAAAAPAVAPAAAQPREMPPRRERSDRDRPERGRPERERQDRPERNSRDDRPSGGNGGSSSSAPRERSGGGQRERSSGGGRRDNRHQPTITDLLREGQEVLVQIAKEPIAKKGARITSHIALPGRFLVYMPTVEHVGVSRKIESDGERVRLRKLIQAIRAEEDVPSGGFIVRTAGVGISEEDLRDDARYLVRTWVDIRRSAEKMKAPTMAHRDLDLVQRLLRDQLSEDFTAIRVDSEEEYLRIVEFINRIQPRMVKRVKLYTRETPILEAYGVQAEIDKAIKPRVWLRSGGYLVINQTEALVAIDVNTGKFVGRGGTRLEDTITRTNLEAVDEIVRQIRLRDLGGIIVLDLIDMEDRRNRNRVMQTLQEALQGDKSPTKVLSFNDFGLVIMTRKRVKQSLERTLC